MESVCKFWIPLIDCCLNHLLEYIDDIDAQRQPNEIITIIVPQFVANEGIASILHARTADTLRKVLLGRKDIVITEVPYQVEPVENFKG